VSEAGGNDEQEAALIAVLQDYLVAMTNGATFQDRRALLVRIEGCGGRLVRTAAEILGERVRDEAQARELAQKMYSEVVATRSLVLNADVLKAPGGNFGEDNSTNKKQEFITDVK
jgi:hypothetical protein